MGNLATCFMVLAKGDGIGPSDTWEIVCRLAFSLVEHKILPPKRIFCNLVVGSLQISLCYPLSTSERMFITWFTSNDFRKAKEELT